MNVRHRVVIAIFAALVGFFATGLAALACGEIPATGSPPDPKAPGGPGQVSIGPGHLIHPCAGMLPEPPFQGLAPLSITYVPGMCTSNVYAAGYGDIALWQANGHSYVALAGFGQRMYHIFNVDDPYNPVLLRSENFPSGGTASLTIFAFKQGANRYMSVGMRGSGAGCGLFVYQVNDPANPVYVGRASGTDWCTVHEHFVSTDANGDADYAWLTMSAESGSGFKVVVLDLHNLPAMPETGRYQRTDSGGGVFSHDVSVIGQRVFLAHWGGGLLIFDKNTLAHNNQPNPLNPENSIRPANFNVHHAWPTTDGNHVFIEDEFINSPSQEKIKLYNISDINNPYYETGIVGPDTITQNNRAHNLKIQPIATGLDRLYVGWYEGGTRGFEVDTRGATPVITNTITHQLRQTTDGQFGDVWGVDYMPCLVHGQMRTCVYSSDMFYGLVIDALGEDATLDPYPPESAITDPTDGQTITDCAYTVRGTAHDYYSGVTQVEFSTDNGLSWLPAQGTTSWTYSWTIPGPGMYTLKSRAHDLAGNIETPSTSILVNVTSCGAATATPPPPTVTPPPPPSTPTPVPTVCTINFSDVPSNDPFYPYIHCLACSGIISGYADGTFRPAENVTRGQTSKIVSNAASFTTSIPPTQQTFADVAGSSPFWLWIERLANRGIISGYTCGGPGEACDPQNHPYFRPYANVTRGQLAKIVSESVQYNDAIPSARQTFSDVAPGSTFWLWVERVALHDVISGYACGGAGEPCDPQGRPYFRPGASATRAQTAKIVANTFYPGCQTPAREQ